MTTMHSPCPKILHTGVSIAVLSESIVFVALNVIEFPKRPFEPLAGQDERIRKIKKNYQQL